MLPTKSNSIKRSLRRTLVLQQIYSTIKNTIMSKIKLTDNTMDVLIKMSDGNPGAATALMSLLKDGAEIDPDAAMGGLHQILMLDTYGIYGTDIYVLWSDICEKDTAKMIAVIRACQLGLFNSRTLQDASGRQDHSGKKLVPVDELHKMVCDRLPNFRKPLVHAE